jgi:adhesin transport system outer membrane protein
MKNSFKLSSIAIGIALAAGLSGGAFGQTLKDAVEQTVRTNPDVLFEANQRLANEEAVKVARGGFMPKVDLLGGYGREGTRSASSFGVRNNQTEYAPSYFNPTKRDDYLYLTRYERQATLSQMLFDGFGVSSEYNRNKARAESAAYKTLGTAEVVGLRGVEKYLEVLRNRELVQLTKENLDMHLKIQDQIKVRSGGGVGRKSDQEQVEARVGLSKANLVAAEANLRDAEIAFLRVVGSKPNALLKAEAPDIGLLPKTEDDAVKFAVENHPILRSATADVKATEYQQQAAKSALYPRLDAELGAAKNDNLDGQPGANDERYAMLRMRWNIFRGLSDMARVNETGYFKVQAMEVMNRTRRQVDESTRLSWNAFISVRERLPSLQEHADKSFATRDSYAQQFNLGQRTLLDLLDSENEAFTAKSDLISAQYLETFARYRLLTDMNQMLAFLGVTPPEEAMYSPK